MHALSDSLTGENVIDTEAVKGVAKVGQLLAALANDIPPQPGDILKKFVFSQNLGEFGKQVETFGKALSAMSKAITGENAIDVNATQNAVNAGNLLSALKDNLPKDRERFLVYLRKIRISENLESRHINSAKL